MKTLVILNPFAVESGLYQLKILLMLTVESGFTTQIWKKKTNLPLCSTKQIQPQRFLNITLTLANSVSILFFKNDLEIYAGKWLKRIKFIRKNQM